MPSDSIHLRFLGGAGTVTGSKFLLEVDDRRILVDCGLFQGLKTLRNLNWARPDYDPATLDLVILTHGHLDHCGYFPRLERYGFTGEIWGTEPSLAVAEIILRDSAKLQEEEANHANRWGYSKHHPAKPLYATEDVPRTLERFRPQAAGKWQQVSPAVAVRFRPVGHIIGAAFLEVDIDGRRLVFSGDVGRPGDPLLPDPERPERADWLVIESTYADRLHPPADPAEQLGQLITESYADGGTLIIPSFSVERAQSLMYYLWQLRQAGKLPAGMPLYLDSPMASRVLHVFDRFPDWHKLSPETCRNMADTIHTVRTYPESLDVQAREESRVVIAGSGMVTGGRVLSYLTRHVEDARTRVLLVGFQAQGTRGRQLEQGIHEIKIFGKYYRVKASIHRLEGLSAHADQQELLHWAGEIQPDPAGVWIVHGEPHAADVLRVKLRDAYGWSTFVPALDETVTLKVPVAG
ncbi:metallo-beta-lactamase family protein [Lewinella marina]|uniref:MBL fold metallo-hydrolase n=1 Tax=Neolewinella marina TaxID=438751 RepID=A0A2G0CCC9_9BACT|nr:MBL fold metallo-hydrolase [Neolewinella marina]NJB87684.1 metallo-beta-lactamase family protein [Neolewinella marina]PHK97634.1 MBL fold metallo-hydrolase [Neolewinella marina]